MATFRRLLLGLTLIFATSGILLLSDLGSRQGSKARTPTPSAPKRVALLQHASQAALDDGREGMIAGLAERGWHVGRNLDITLYNAEGDMPTAQTIAKAMVSGNYDLLLTDSTPSLQAVANANRATGRPHVFGLVTDPYGAGVGINPEDHLDHPPYLAGYGTLQPVAAAFQLARELNPELATVGVVWNASESNSAAQIKLAKAVCADLGITLLEVTVDNSAGVGEAAAAVVARGAEALWVPGDVTIIIAIDSVVASAKKAGIPVFSVIPPNVKRGALFDLGADYGEVGHQAGLLAGEILNGRDPATVSIDNYMPEVLMVNRQALAGLNDGWSLSDEVVARAQLVIDENGNELSRTAATASTPSPDQKTIKPEPGRTYRVAFGYYAPDPSCEVCQKGLLDGLAKLGFVEGKNLEVTRTHAQGERVNIRPMLVNMDHTPADVIVTFSTPVLMGALAAVQEKPVVFTFVTDPLAAGAGRTFEDHSPKVTGIGSLPPVADLARLMRLAIPNLKRLGTIYNSGEANSVKVVTLMREVCAQLGIELVELTAPTPGDVMQAAQAVVGRNVDAVWLPSDNTAYQAIEAIAKTTSAAKVPLIGDDGTFIDHGFLFTAGPGFYYSGFAAAEPLARVLTGTPPADIPMANVAVSEGKFNRAQMEFLGLNISEDVIAEIESSGSTASAPAPGSAATDQARNPNPSGKKWNIQVYFYMESPPFEQAIEGMQKVLAGSPLVEDRDYTLRVRSAQGDMGALNGIVDAILTERADLIVPLSTPGLQAAGRRIKETPIVFGVVADPVAAGVAKSYTDHPANLTGITVMGPAAEMLDLLEQHFPQYKRLGTLFCPAEANSVFFKDTFARLCEERGFALEVVAANSPGEIPDAALALVSRPIDAVVQIPDNQSSAGFTAITRAARQAQKPLLSLNSTSVSLGAALAMGRDYEYSGEEVGNYIVRVIGGESPADIPILLSPKIYIAASVPNATAVGMKLPEAVLKDARDVEH